MKNFPHSRAAFSLLAYCRYHSHDYHAAASLYEQLVRICPNVEEYKLNHAQSLHKASMYPEAMRTAVSVTTLQQKQHAIILQAAIKYEQVGACRKIVQATTRIYHHCICRVEQQLKLLWLLFITAVFNDTRVLHYFSPERIHFSSFRKLKRMRWWARMSWEHAELYWSRSV